MAHRLTPTFIIEPRTSTRSLHSKAKASASWHWLSLLYTYPQPERWGPFMAEVYSRRKDMVISVSSRLP